jgi:hypothetical protein|tara:strand:- start:12029 stop:12223 length:195 start_codon:yes stop_codon:yes gene_type:complete
MAYTYRVDVSLTANVEVEAESYAVAKELAEEWLNLESLDNRVSMPSTDGIVVECIESDDDPDHD